MLLYTLRILYSLIQGIFCSENVIPVQVFIICGSKKKVWKWRIYLRFLNDLFLWIHMVAYTSINLHAFVWNIIFKLFYSCVPTTTDSQYFCKISRKLCWIAFSAIGECVLCMSATYVFFLLWIIFIFRLVCVFCRVMSVQFYSIQNYNYFSDKQFQSADCFFFGFPFNSSVLFESAYNNGPIFPLLVR